MSGHSKWSKVKHQKATTDAVKSAAFTKASRAITIAVREGGGVADPGGNFKLRLAIDNARAVNMPKDTIERAIERAKTVSDHLEPFLYEGYGPGGVAVLVEGVTDNRQRTAALLKHAFDKVGGSLGGPGSVSYLFRREGAISVRGVAGDMLLELALSSGADDVEEGNGEQIVYTTDTALHTVAERLQNKAIAVTQSRIVFRPIVRIEVDPKIIELASEFLNALLDLDDVSDVYANI